MKAAGEIAALMAQHATAEAMLQAIEAAATDLAHYRALLAEYDRIRTERARADFRGRVARGELHRYGGRV